MGTVLVVQNFLAYIYIATLRRVGLAPHQGGGSESRTRKPLRAPVFETGTLPFGTSLHARFRVRDCPDSHSLHLSLASPARVELAVSAFAGPRSIQLSYGDTCVFYYGSRISARKRLFREGHFWQASLNCDRATFFLPAPETEVCLKEVYVLFRR